MTEYAGQQFVGIDLHRRRSVIVRTTESGEVLEAVQILNDVDRLNSVMERAGEDPEVVLEATYGWYWAVDDTRRVHEPACGRLTGSAGARGGARDGWRRARTGLGEPDAAVVSPLVSRVVSRRTPLSSFERRGGVKRGFSMGSGAVH